MPYIRLYVSEKLLNEARDLANKALSAGILSTYEPSDDEEIIQYFMCYGISAVEYRISKEQEQEKNNFIETMKEAPEGF